MLNVRNDFPETESNVQGGKNLVYLDSAATALKPNVVIDRFAPLLFHGNFNVHR